MLAIKYTPNIFLLSIYVSSLLQQDIRFVKVCVCVCVCVCVENLETIIFE